MGQGVGPYRQGGEAEHALVLRCVRPVDGHQHAHVRLRQAAAHTTSANTTSARADQYTQCVEKSQAARFGTAKQS